ncbi:endonuclease/exonuclease/phosphatase family protein [Streptomyces sp. 4F14]|uniref:endonuclease/exonuclease/phosphatase family protein n=1 Tax=Streptomyces sp. 4F14 TaxID=3394380 RepID=UPI003A8BAE9F
MRIISWNLRDGGRSGDGHQRLARAVDIVRAHGPDLDSFQEARGFDGRLLDDMVGRPRLSGFLATADSGYHVAAFTRTELAATCTRFGRPDFFHALIALRLLLSDGGTLYALGAHWCPDFPDTRLTEAANLIELVRADEPTLLVGDLNSPDPHGDHPPDLRPEDRARYCASDSTTADTRALRRLESAGLVDVGRLRGETGPTLPTCCTDSAGSPGPSSRPGTFSGAFTRPCTR